VQAELTSAARAAPRQLFPSCAVPRSPRRAAPRRAAPRRAAPHSPRRAAPRGAAYFALLKADRLVARG
jgi:hypothetical protein